MLARENKGNAAGKTDKVAMQEVQDMLKKHYQVSWLCSRSTVTTGIITPPGCEGGLCIHTAPLEVTFACL
jgi:hypothetical protein